MSNRRRSERYPVSLPIWLKDAHGGERTRTVDVSAHGLAVVTNKERPLRQYVELEIDLSEPEVQIAVTAVVARRADVAPDEDASGGLGLDFFLFDAQAKKHWQAFLRRLSASEVDESPVSQAPPPPPPAEVEETPTFIIKPRDLGRLWAFYRGELAKGMARIETPVAKEIGLPVELLVVHPSSQSEWVLAGRVSTSQASRGGRTELQIDLGRPDGDLKAAFRNFVATGQGMIEEEVSLDFEVPPSNNGAVPDRDSEVHRIQSVVIDLDEASEEAPIELLVRRATGEEPAAANDLADASETEDPTAISGRYEEAEDDASAEMSDEAHPEDALQAVEAEATDDDPTADKATILEEVSEREWDGALTLSNEGDAADPVVEAPLHEASADLNDSGEHQSIESADLVAEQDEPEHLPTAVQIDPPAVQELSEPEGDAIAEPVLPPSPARHDLVTPPALEPLPLTKAPNAIPPAFETKNERPATPPAAPQGEREEQPRAPSLSLSNRNIFAAFFEEAEAAEPSLVPPAAGSSVAAPEISERVASLDPRYDPSAPYQAPRGGRLSPQATAPGRATSSPPPIPVESPQVRVVKGAPVQAPLDEPLYSFSESEVEDHELPVQPQPAPAAAPAQPPTAARRVAGPPRSIEEGHVVAHRNVASEGHNPDLDRQIALARARMVRSPHSVTACYRLSTLLLQSGQNDGLGEAAESLRQVVRMEPNHPGAHHKLAELLAREGRYTEAADHLARARRLGYQVDPDLELVVQEALRGRPSSAARE